MSLHEVFDYVWNYPIPWFWILAGLGGLYLLAILVGIIAYSDANRSK